MRCQKVLLLRLDFRAISSVIVLILAFTLNQDICVTIKVLFDKKLHTSLVCRSSNCYNFMKKKLYNNLSRVILKDKIFILK